MRSIDISGAEFGRLFGCSKELVNMVRMGEIWQTSLDDGPPDESEPIIATGTCGSLHYKNPGVL